MTTAADITGSWRGHYEQSGGRRGISMQVVQKGQSFVGRMRDAETLLSGSAELLRVDADGVELEPLRMESVGELPEYSIVEGSVVGDHVEFDKVYQGAHRITVWVPGHGEAQHEIPEHRVTYRGRLQAGATVLRGEWRIRAPRPDLDGAVGSFELRRQ